MLPLPVLHLDVHVPLVLQRLNRRLVTQNIPRVHHRERHNQQRQQESDHRDHHPLDIKRANYPHAANLNLGPRKVPCGILCPVPLPTRPLSLALQRIDQQRDHAPDTPHRAQAAIQNKQIKLLIVPEPDTAVHPGAVVVHPQHTHVAFRAMVAPVRFHNLANLAPARATVALADTQGRQRALEGVVFDVDTGPGATVGQHRARGARGREVDARAVAAGRGVVWDDDDMVVFVVAVVVFRLAGSGKGGHCWSDGRGQVLWRGHHGRDMWTLVGSRRRRRDGG